MARLIRFPLALGLVLASAQLQAQTSYRLKGTVKDSEGAPIAGARIRAEALHGFRGEQFVGQKEFATTSDANGAWNILGLTSGMWAFDVTAPNLVPQVVVLPVQYTQRKMQSAIGGQLPWELPLILGRTTNALLLSASDAATSGRAAEAISLAGGLATENDGAVLCGAGHVALLARQHTLAGALFQQISARAPKDPCATLGRASATLMQGDVVNAGKWLWEARDVVPQNQRRALAAAIGDLQQMSGFK